MAEVENLDRLRRKLKALPEAFEKAAKDALAEAAQGIVDTAKRFLSDPGPLSDSIDWTFGEAPKGSLVIKGGGLRVGRRFIKVTIFAGNEKAFYARFREFGTAPHAQGGMFKGTLHPGTSAAPFFYPAYRLHKKKAKRLAAKRLKEEAKRIAAQ